MRVTARHNGQLVRDVLDFTDHVLLLNLNAIESLFKALESLVGPVVLFITLRGDDVNDAIFVLDRVNVPIIDHKL